MKNTFYFLVGFILFNTSCSQSSGSAPKNMDQPTVIEAPPNATVTGDKYEVRLNLEKGKIYTQRCSAGSTILQTMGAQTASMSLLAKTEVTFKVLDIQNDVYDMEVRYEKLSVTISMQQTERLYTTESSEDDMLTKTMQALRYKPFSIKMTKAGKVQEIKGMESLLESILSGYKGMDENTLRKMRSQMTQAFGENTLKGNIELCSAIFPETAVAKGERWMVTGELIGAMVLKVDNSFEIKDMNDQFYQLSGNSKIASQNNDTYAEMNGVKMKYDMKGTMTSDIMIDRKSGWIKKASYNQFISGTAIIKGAANMPEETIVPMTLTSETSITD